MAVAYATFKTRSICDFLEAAVLASGTKSGTFLFRLLTYAMWFNTE